MTEKNDGVHIDRIAVDYTDFSLDSAFIKYRGVHVLTELVRT